MILRFTDEEDKRLEKMLKRRKLTKQAFGHAAIMKALNEIELGKRTDDEVVKEAREEQKQKTLEPKGFGIRERLIADRERDDEADQAERDRERSERVDRARHVTVTASAPSLTPMTIDGEILALARSVVQAPRGEQRTTVLRAACRSLAPRARTEEEAKYLVDQLYDAVKRLDGTTMSALEKVRARMGR